MCSVYCTLSQPEKHSVEGIVHFLTMSILKEQAVNEYHNGFFLPFSA